jgi:hypothetical protein
MTLTRDRPTDRLALEFVRTSTELAEARDRQAQKDSTAHCAAVADWLDRIDRILDMFLETGRASQ